MTSLPAYESFDLDDLCDDECKAEFRFMENDIYQMKDVLQVPDEIVCYNRLVVKGIKALCVLLNGSHTSFATEIYALDLACTTV